MRLDAAHITARRDAPEREWDPENGMALCRSCHMKHDHANGHRPSGRPVGYRHTKESRKKMSESARVRAADPLEIARRRQNAIKQWDGIGRKPDRDCDHCGTPLTRRQVSGGSRFCSAACHYEFRRGKARSGY